jgi:hypothetical protein
MAHDLPIVFQKMMVLGVSLYGRKWKRMKEDKENLFFPEKLSTSKLQVYFCS